jgi:hypothetical protein
MGEASAIGLDLAKRVFQAHGADMSGGGGVPQEAAAGSTARVFRGSAVLYGVLVIFLQKVTLSKSLILHRIIKHGRDNTLI